MNPLGPADPRSNSVAFQALFRRNALRPPEEAELHPAEDRAELQTGHDHPPATTADRGDKPDEKPQKKYRTPSYPLPPAPLPRQPRPQGFLLSAAPPAPAKKGREMEEKDLSSYSRWKARDSGPTLFIEEDAGQQESAGQDRPEPPADDPLEAMCDDPPGSPGLESLKGWLGRFGPRVLHTCRNFGLRVKLQPGGPWGYHQPQNLLWAQLEELSSFPGETLLGLARAYDLALGGGVPASRSALAVLAQRPPGSPDDFFASSLVDHVFRGGGGPLSDYLAYLIGPRPS